jgi:hypothetical protein
MEPSESPENERPPGEEAMDGRAEGLPQHVADGERGTARTVFAAVGFVLLRFAIGMAVPVLLVIILAFIAQVMISGH